jgi:hypothetical protein
MKCGIKRKCRALWETRGTFFPQNHLRDSEGAETFSLELLASSPRAKLRPSAPHFTLCSSGVKINEPVASRIAAVSGGTVTLSYRLRPSPMLIQLVGRTSLYGV